MLPYQSITILVRSPPVSSRNAGYREHAYLALGRWSMTSSTLLLVFRRSRRAHNTPDVLSGVAGDAATLLLYW